MKYNTAKIYEIRCNLTNRIYIGSTIKSLYERLKKHEKDYRQHLKGNCNNITSFEIIKDNNYEIYLLEEHPCDSVCDIRKREGKWQKLFKSYGFDVVNKNIEGREIDEKKEVHNEQQKNYYLNNCEVVKQKARETYEKGRSEYHKIYYEVNKEKLKVQNSTRCKQRTICECGAKVSKGSLSGHKKSKKHLAYIQALNV